MSNKRKLRRKKARVARIDLPSKQADGTPNWVEYRDRLMALDRFEVQDAVSMEVGGDKGRSRVSLGMQNDLRNALLGRIITDWSFDQPVPAKNDFAAADKVIGSVLDLEDYAVLEAAVEPLMDLIGGRRQPDPKTRSGS